MFYGCTRATHKATKRLPLLPGAPRIRVGSRLFFLDPSRANIGNKKVAVSHNGRLSSFHWPHDAPNRLCLPRCPHPLKPVPRACRAVYSIEAGLSVPLACALSIYIFAFENEPLVSLGTTASTGRGPRQQTTWRAPTTIATCKVCKEDQGGRCEFIVKICCFSLPPWAPDSASVFPVQCLFAAVRSRSRGEAKQYQQVPRCSLVSGGIFFFETPPDQIALADAKGLWEPGQFLDC